MEKVDKVHTFDIKTGGFKIFSNQGRAGLRKNVVLGRKDNP
jgi:hypothetical protein